MCPLFKGFAQPTVYYIDDSQGDYTPNHVFEKTQSSLSEFTKTPGAINLRFESSKIWVIVDSTQLKGQQVVVIPNLFLDNINAYFYDQNKQIGTIKSGSKVEFKNRSFDYIFPNFKIPERTNSMLLEVQTTNSMKVPVNLFSYSQFLKFSQDSTSFHFLYFGILSLTIILSILVYTWVNNSLFIYYALSLSGTMLLTASNFGYLFKFLWPQNPSINSYTMGFLALGVLHLVFVEKLLNLKKNHRTLLLIFRVFYILFATIMLGVGITKNQFFSLALSLIFCIYPFLPLVAGVLVYKKIEFKISLYFTLGILSFFGSIGVFVAMQNGAFPINLFTENSIQIGTLAEIMFFNIALIYRIKFYRQQQQNILLKEKNSLEKKVLSRTMELTLKNKLIEEKNQQLESHQELLEKKVEKRTTELLKTNKELNDRNFRLEQFANVTAHNLRGPVATLLGLCNIFNQQDASDPLNLTIIKNIQESATKVDGILRDLSTLLDHHQNAESMVEEIQLEAIFMQVMHILKIEFEKSGGKISTDFSHAPTVVTVPVYIKNIFYNLISNGLKYKKQNFYPEIEIKSYLKDQFVCLEFKDHGIGIDLEKFGEKLFQPYQRFHISFPGKGLGLYTCKTQIESMGGKIEVSSEVGSGTTFTIFLPDKKPKEENAPKTSIKEQENALS